MPMSFLSRLFNRNKKEEVIPQSVVLGREILELLGSTPHVMPAEQFEKRIAAGADLTVCDSVGQTPLMIAVLHHHSLAYLFMKDSASLEAKDSFGYTALSIAAANGYDDMIDALIAAKADVNTVSNKKDTPLIRAAEKGHLDTVKKLLAAGADIDAQGKWGNTALIAAAANGENAVVAYLLKEGARTDLKNKDGHTARQSVSLQGARSQWFSSDRMMQMFDEADAETAKKVAAEQAERERVAAEALKAETDKGLPLKEKVALVPRIRLKRD